MIVSRIILKNWRNFRSVDVPLRERMFIVGPNASGKSNFLDVFRFLRDIAKPEGGGLQKAIRDRGGIPKLRCLFARQDPQNEININLAVEDPPSEAILRKILNQSGCPYSVANCLCRGGFGYLKKKISHFNKAARSIPFLILTDLDNSPCPPQMIKSWLNIPEHPNLLFRIAVREVESWILADRAAIADFLGISEKKIPYDTDSLPDPKACLIQLARKSRSRSLREDLVPPSGATSRQEPNYNNRISDFIRNHWNADTASRHSRSLRRALERLRNFKPV